MRVLGSSAKLVDYVLLGRVNKFFRAKSVFDDLIFH